MKYLSAVTEAARALNLIGDDGKLVALDSLAILDLISELERNTQLSIPSQNLEPEALSSLESIAAMLEGLEQSATA